MQLKMSSNGVVYHTAFVSNLTQNWFKVHPFHVNIKGETKTAHSLLAFPFRDNSNVKD